MLRPAVEVFERYAGMTNSSLFFLYLPKKALAEGEYYRSMGI
jgi:hypothetical protein